MGIVDKIFDIDVAHMLYQIVSWFSTVELAIPQIAQYSPPSVATPTIAGVYIMQVIVSGAVAGAYIKARTPALEVEAKPQGGTQ